MNAAVGEEAPAEPDEPIGVLVVDDALMWRETLRRDLEREPDIRVVAEAENGQQAVALATELVPDVILMDLSMPVMGGIEATRLIHAELPSLRVLVLTQREEDEDVVGALRAGAVGYLLKDISAQELIHDVRRVFQGEVVFTERLAGLVLAEIRNPTLEDPNGFDTFTTIGLPLAGEQGTEVRFDNVLARVPTSQDY